MSSRKPWRTSSTTTSQPLCDSLVCRFWIWCVRSVFFLRKWAKITVNSDLYCHMLETFIRPNLNQFAKNHEKGEVWFKQDWATVHTSRRSLAILRVDPGCLLSLEETSPGPQDHPTYLLRIFFFFWDIWIWRHKLYNYRPRSLQALVEAITQAMAAIHQKWYEELWKLPGKASSMCK